MPKQFSTADIPKFQQGTAYVTGWRNNTVRIKLPDGTDTTLCTVTYSCDMYVDLQQAVAQRIADMWNANRR